MPTVHPQVQKARDLMPLIAAAADESTPPDIATAIFI